MYQNHTRSDVIVLITLISSVSYFVATLARDCFYFETVPRDDIE